MPLPLTWSREETRMPSHLESFPFPCLRERFPQLLGCTAHPLNHFQVYSSVELSTFTCCANITTIHPSCILNFLTTVYSYLTNMLESLPSLSDPPTTTTHRPISLSPVNVYALQATTSYPSYFPNWASWKSCLFLLSPLYDLLMITFCSSFILSPIWLLSPTLYWSRQWLAQILFNPLTCPLSVALSSLDSDSCFSYYCSHCCSLLWNGSNLFICPSLS